MTGALFGASRARAVQPCAQRADKMMHGQLGWNVACGSRYPKRT